MDTAAKNTAVEEKQKPKKRRKKKKVLRKVILVLVLILLVGAAVYACSPKRSAKEGLSVYKNDIYTAARADVSDTISATGLVESSEDTTAKVYSTLSYKIDTVNVSLGDTVAEGDVLCVYDTETLERQIKEKEYAMSSSERNAALNLANAKLTYETFLAGVEAGTNASLVNAESSYATASDNLERAQKDYDDYAAKLADSAVLTLNQAKRNLDDAQKNYDDLKDDIDNKTHSQIRNAQKTVDSAKENYEDYKADLENGRLSSLHSADAACDSYLSALEDARERLDELQTALLGASGEDPAEIARLEEQVAVQEANVKMLRENYTAALDTYDLAVDEANRLLDTYKEQYDNAVDAYDDVIESLEKTLDSYATALANAKDSYQNALEGTDDTLENYATALTGAERSFRDAEINLENTKISVNNQLENYRISYQNAQNSANTELSDYQLANLYTDLGKATVTAPIAGTVTAVYAAEGESASGVLFVIEDTDSLVVTSTVKAYDLDRVKEGMRVTIESDVTGDRVYAGVIESIAPTAAKDATGSVISTNDAEFETVVRVTDTNTGLKIGVSARIAYVVEEAKQTLTLPESAILYEGRESFVLRVTDKAEDGSFMLERVPVTVGVSDGVNTAVDGIAEGDEIVDNADSYRLLVGRRLTLSENSMLAGSMNNMFMMGGMGGMSGGRAGGR